MDLIQIADCPRETGVSRRTVYRWISQGKLHSRKDGRVCRRAVEKLKGARRTGRRHGLSALEKVYLVRDARALASPYLHASGGLALFESVGGLVIAHHGRLPLGRKCVREALARLYALL